MNKIQKTKLMRVKEILERETDAEHGITMDRLLDILAMYGIFAERKSVYGDIDLLQEMMGMDISRPSKGNKEYRVLSRQFEVSELRLIIDAIQADKCLSERTADALIHKLESLCSKHEAHALQDCIYTSKIAKASSDSTMNNIGYLHEAILGNRQITFRYFDYTWEGKKKYRNDGGKNLYVVSPYYLMYDNGKYYMLGYVEGITHDIRTYRVDHMANICLLNEERVGQEVTANIDPATFQKGAFSMFGGETQPVTLVCEDELAGAVMDKFGYDLMTSKEDERHFRVSVGVHMSKKFYGWVFGFGGGIRIAGPQVAVDGYRDMLKEMCIAAGVEPA